MHILQITISPHTATPATASAAAGAASQTILLLICYVSLHLNNKCKIYVNFPFFTYSILCWYFVVVIFYLQSTEQCSPINNINQCKELAIEHLYIYMFVHQFSVCIQNNYYEKHRKPNIRMKSSIFQFTLNTFVMSILINSTIEMIENNKNKHYWLHWIMLYAP